MNEGYIFWCRDEKHCLICNSAFDQILVNMFGESDYIIVNKGICQQARTNRETW